MLQKIFLVVFFILGLFTVNNYAQAFASYERFPIASGDVVSKIAHDKVGRGGNEWRQNYVVIARPLADGTLRIIPKTQAHKVFVGDIVLIKKSHIKKSLEVIEKKIDEDCINQSNSINCNSESVETAVRAESEDKATVVNPAIVGNTNSESENTATSVNQLNSNTAVNAVSPGTVGNGKNQEQLPSDPESSNFWRNPLILLLFIPIIAIILLYKKRIKRKRPKDTYARNYRELAVYLNQAASIIFPKPSEEVVDSEYKPRKCFDFTPHPDSISIEFCGYDHSLVHRHLAQWLTEIGLSANLTNVSMGLEHDKVYMGTLEVSNPLPFQVPKEYTPKELEGLRQEMQEYGKQFAETFLLSYGYMDVPLFYYKVHPIPHLSKCQLVIEPNPASHSFPFPAEAVNRKSIHNTYEMMKKSYDTYEVELTDIHQNNKPVIQVVVEFQFKGVKKEHVSNLREFRKQAAR